MKSIRKKRKWIGSILAFTLICGCTGFGIAGGIEYYERNNVGQHVHHNDNVDSLEGEHLGDATVSSVSTTPYVSTASFGKIAENSKTLKEDLSSEYAILVRISDGTILLDKYATEKMYPASLTKLMTVLVAFDHIEDLNKEVTLPEEIFKQIENENASVAGFEVGETVKTIDLLYGAMLPSGAECCLGLANELAVGEDNYVTWMNEKAEELGMEDSHFSNTTGLQDTNHYTTAYDLAILLNECLKNEAFKSILSTKRYSIPSTNKHPDGMTIYSTTLTKIEDTGLEASEITGGKTGFTSDAGLCLASFGTVNNEEYLLVTAGAKGNSRSRQYNIYDAIEVYDELK